jgi:HAD superfamily hydrolase (TIGR01509 family)
MKMTKQIMRDNQAGPAPQRRYEALLIDLDGTLLRLDLGRFVPAYIEAMARYFEDRFPPEKFAAHLLAATMHTIGCKDCEQSNEDVFFADFCRRVGMEREALDPLIEDFYRAEFPRLQAMSKPRSHAREVLETARKRCRKVVLATQPVFPRSAAFERLSWGGLSADYFDHITTIENTHSCKPHQEYYLEIAKKIGIPPEQCLMAGNDTLEDIGAAKTGMGTFLVEGGIIDHGRDALPHDHRGTLADLAALIEESFGPADR